MRLAVLADIHGNLPALEAVLTRVQQQNVDGIIVAGDHFSDGPNPIEVLRLIQSLDNTWLIRGNTDNRILAFDTGDVPEVWYTSNQWTAWQWLHNSLDRMMLDFIASLPEQCVISLDGTAPIRVVHGSPRSPSEHLFPDRDPASLSLFRKAGLLPPNDDPGKLDDTLAEIDESVLICAHSHIPWKQEQNGRLVFNPGAVGEPISGTRAHYAWLTWQDNCWRVKHETIPYDLDRVRTAYKKSGLLTEENAFTRAILLGMETGQNVVGHFLSHVFSLAQEADCEDCDGVFPDEIWKRAIATFDWEPSGWGTTI